MHLRKVYLQCNTILHARWSVADVTLHIACYTCSITTCPIIGAPSANSLQFSYSGMHNY